MGLQAAFIHTTCSNVERNNSDLEKYIEMFKKYDVRCDGDWLADCVERLHFNKTVGKYKKGMDILVIYGERQAVRNSGNLFDCDNELDERDKTSLYTNDEMKLIRRARITFAEEECDVLAMLDNEEYITREKLKLKPVITLSNFNEVDLIVKSIFDEIFSYSESNGKKIERSYQYQPQNEKDVEFILNLFKQRFGEKGYKVKVVERVKNGFKGKNLYKDIYVNNIYVGCCSYSTGAKKYQLNLFNLTGQELRWICKKLLKQEDF